MYLPASNTLGFSTNSANTANLLTTGFVVGATALIDPTTGTTDGASMGTNGQFKGSVNGGRALWLRRRGSDGEIGGFWRDTTQVGNISVTTTATAYNTSSDKRLKDNIREFTESGEIIDNLQIVKHGWKYSKAAPESINVLAQDAATIFPDAISKGDDAEDNTPDKEDFQAWGVDYSRFVPLLLAEAKQLRLRINQLEQGL
jgi:hypothetical protein